MKWRKHGLIFTANGHAGWAKSHAMIPTPLLIEGKLIVYVGFCDDKGISRMGFVELDPKNPMKILNISQEPALSIGEDGTFDENGVLQCSVINHDGQFYAYYAGFELGTKIRYRLLTGLAIGNTYKRFARYKQVPVLERSDKELYFRGGPFVLHENGIFKMWYVAGSSWENINGKQMPVYTINYIESNDGKNWPDSGKVCIPIENDNEHGFGRPYVVRLQNLYYLFFSVRIKHLGYRLGYAVSKDGLKWERKYDINLDISSNSNDFDGETICYPAVIELNNKIWMFYNGNEFGKTGFGLAELVSFNES